MTGVQTLAELVDHLESIGKQAVIQSTTVHCSGYGEERMDLEIVVIDRDPATPKPPKKWVHVDE